MKKLEAIVRYDKFGYVKDALANAGYTSLTAYDVKGRGRQSGIIKTVGGKKLRADMLLKTKMEIVVEDKNVEKVINIIITTARTGIIGDGKIFVSTVDDVIRIRTGEHGNDAL